MIPLGCTVRDVITGFTGIVTARTEYLYSTPILRVQPTVLTASNCHPGVVELEEAQCCVVPEQDLETELKKVVL
jgi:hypothetical protein